MVKVKEHVPTRGNNIKQLQRRMCNPQVSIDSVFMTCTLEASERRDVAVIDLPGAFLHVDCNDHVIMRFQGRLDRLMVLATPQIYRTYITTGSKHESILFVKLQKALHGMVKSALLFYKNCLPILWQKNLL